VFDGPAVVRVAPPDADDMLPLLEQPLALSRLRVALIIFGGSPTKRKGAQPIAVIGRDLGRERTSA
jgi:hypothetical protein